MRKHLKYVIASIIVAATAQSAVAAFFFDASPNTSEATTVTKDAEPETVHLSDVEVVAARQEKSTTAEYTLDATTFRVAGVTDISDAIHRLPGVNLRDYGGSGGMKTVSVRGLGTQHTGVTYDGVALGDAQSGQIDLSRFSLDCLSSLSIRMGDGDDLLQSARTLSLASTLSIATIDEADLTSRRPELAVKLRVASFGTWNPSLRFGIANGSNFKFSLNGEYLHARNNYPFTIYNGKETTREKRNNSQTNTGHVEMNSLWKISDDHSLQAKTYWYDSSRDLPGPVKYYNNKSNQHLHDKDLMAQLRYDGRFASNVFFRALAKYDWTDLRYTDIDGIYPNGSLDNRYIQQEEYISAALKYTPITDLALSYCVDYWHNAMSNNLRANNHPQRNSLLQSISVKYRIWRLTATAHGLLSYISDLPQAGEKHIDRWKVSPSIGFNLQPIADEQWYIRTSYKSGMRMPTFNELYFDHYGSINLEPEIARQLNLGMTWSRHIASWLPSLELSADGYLDRVKNKIVAMPYNMFVMTMKNLGEVRILGADVTLSADFSPAEGHDLILTGNYSYQRAASRTDRTMADWMKQLPYIPLNSGGWSLTWQNPWVNVVAHVTGCSARYAETVNLPSSRIPGYMEIGFSLYREIRIKQSSLTLRADLINALDKQYEIVARYPMPGRSWAVSIEYRL